MHMYRIGIDLGGTSIAAGLVDGSRRIVDKLSVPTNAPRPMAGIADDMAALTEELLARNGLRREDLSAVGVGVPGTANRENGHLEDANNLGCDDEPFVSVLEERLGLPVRFGNDANAAAWGEYQASGSREDSFVMMTIGTGIGGGVILNGKLWDGINGAAAEFGHMTIRYDGMPCTCGRTGCFEAYASATALIRQARERMAADRDTLLWKLCGGEPDRVEARTVFEGAAAGDGACRAGCLYHLSGGGRGQYRQPVPAGRPLRGRRREPGRGATPDAAAGENGEARLLQERQTQHTDHSGPTGQRRRHHRRGPAGAITMRGKNRHESTL